MIALVVFWSTGLGPFGLIFSVWALSPLLVPILLMLRLRFMLAKVSVRTCLLSTSAAMPYALPEIWLGGPLILAALGLMVLCPIVSWWLIFNQEYEKVEKIIDADKKWLLVMLIPYALIIATMLYGPKGSALG